MSMYSMMYSRILCIITLSFTIVTTSFAQTDSIDVFIKTEMQKRKIPGLQLAIVKNGHIIKTANYGIANIQDSIPVSDQTVFTINSITKAFTGVAIMQLAEAGKLNLTAPVSRYLADLPESWGKVTIQQLLSHISGIPDIVDEEEAVLIAPNGDAAWQKVITMPMDFTPGERFSYNQTNYLILGQVIDKLAGIPFTNFIINEQLRKTGMDRTIQAGFGATKEIVMHAAAGYQFSQGKLNNMFFSFPPFLQTAAGMSSTAKEMANWIIALQNYQILKKPSSLAALWAPALLNNGTTRGFSGLLNGYAAGWPVISRSEHPAVAPVGGGRSALFVYPDDGLSIIVLTNLAGGAPDVFIDELAGLFIPDMKAVNGFGLSLTLKLLRSRMEEKGYKYAVAEANKIRKTDAASLNEKEINNWGYKLISQKKIKEALEIFKLNVALYPESGNAFDSLAEIYSELGETELAIYNYEHSLKLNPGNTNALVQLKRLKTL